LSTFVSAGKPADQQENLFSAAQPAVRDFGFSNQLLLSKNTAETPAARVLLGRAACQLKLSVDRDQSSLMFKTRAPLPCNAEIAQWS
jgi:hypothetical protein